MVGHNYDANYIMGVPLRNRKGATIGEFWQHIHDTFKKAGVAPDTYVLDNEYSKDLIQAFELELIQYQLVTPSKHQNNKARYAIRTFKAHFKECLASLDPNCPLSEWDFLLMQTNITLNPLRSSRSNPQLSAQNHMFGEFNFLATPLSPPGTNIVAHIYADKKGSWDLNGEVGWYVGP